MEISSKIFALNYLKAIQNDRIWYCYAKISTTIPYLVFCRKMMNYAGLDDITTYLVGS